jgi:hypothetical protein
VSAWSRAGGHGPLSKVIQSVEQVREMSTEALESLLAMHETEVAQLVGAIEARTVESPPRARTAERILRLHQSWIDRELKDRRVEQERQAAKQAKEARAESHQQTVAKAHAEKLARISASNDENMRQLAVFKAVAREVLGAEQYLHLWTLVRQRMTSVATIPRD